MSLTVTPINLDEANAFVTVPTVKQRLGDTMSRTQRDLGALEYYLYGYSREDLTTGLALRDAGRADVRLRSEQARALTQHSRIMQTLNLLRLRPRKR